MEYTDNGQQIGQETGTWGEKLQEGIEQPVYLQKIPEKKEYNFRSLKRCFRIIGLAYLVYLLVSTASQVVVSLIFQMPELIGEIHMDAVRIFQTARLLPQGGKLFFAVFLDIHDLGGLIDPFPL